MPRFIVVLLVWLVGVSPTCAQDGAAFDPTGYWTGAIIKDGSTLPITVEIEPDGSGYTAKTLFTDWIFYRPTARETVEPTDEGMIIRDLLSGDATLIMEPDSQQMTGRIGDDGRTVHLKRGVPPPEPSVETRDVGFVSPDGTRLAGSLSLPRRGEALGAMVMVRGRGCASRVNNRARFFARYGMAVLTYDKRGSGDSEGDCATFTLDDLAEDALAAFDFLAAHPRIDSGRVGFFGESAGAWTVQAATERRMTDTEAALPAFIVTWIGPATSILQQQIGSATTYGESVGLSRAQQDVLVDATRIIADGTLSDDAAYARLARIRESARADGWLDKGFGPDDLPRSREGMDGLWLRRFRYDPSRFLGKMGDLPYLSVLGAKDPIVPVEENADALRMAAPHARVVVLPESGHGYDHVAQSRPRLDGEPLWIFEGPDVGFTAETVRFLREQGIMTR